MKDVDPTALETYIQQTVDAAPPLSQAQQDKLAVLMAGKRKHHSGFQVSHPEPVRIKR